MLNQQFLLAGTVLSDLFCFTDSSVGSLSHHALGFIAPISPMYYTAHTNYFWYTNSWLTFDLVNQTAKFYDTIVLKDDLHGRICPKIENRPSQAECCKCHIDDISLLNLAWEYNKMTYVVEIAQILNNSKVKQSALTAILRIFHFWT